MNTEKIIALCTEGIERINESDLECRICKGTGIKSIELLETFNSAGFCRHPGSIGRYYLEQILSEVKENKSSSFLSKYR